MRAEELIKNAQVKEALLSLSESIRDKPSDVSLRTFLFQLLCIDGQFQRAHKQLGLIQELDPITMAMSKTYQHVIQCETLRQAIFSADKTPLVFGEPPHWVALLIEALRLENNNQQLEAEKIRQNAYQDIPPTQGMINGESFEWLADADSRIGPLMEGFINGHYFWIPLQCIAKIKLSEPEDLRDLIWLPCEFHWVNGGGATGFIPACYPNSCDDEDPLIQMGRKTHWAPIAEQSFMGKGQKMLVTDQNDYPLFDVREIVFSHEP